MNINLILSISTFVAVVVVFVFIFFILKSKGTNALCPACNKATCPSAICPPAVCPTANCNYPPSTTIEGASWIPGNNGTISCDAYCARTKQTCLASIGSRLEPTSGAIYPTNYECSFATGLGAPVTCLCK